MYIGWFTKLFLKCSFGIKMLFLKPFLVYHPRLPNCIAARQLGPQKITEGLQMFGGYVHQIQNPSIRAQNFHLFHWGWENQPNSVALSFQKPPESPNIYPKDQTWAGIWKTRVGFHIPIVRISVIVRIWVFHFSIRLDPVTRDSPRLPRRVLAFVVGQFWGFRLIIPEN